MKKSSLIYCLIIFFILSGQQAFGASLSFIPAETTLGLNETIDVSVWISGIGVQGEPNLGGYDLDIRFDPDVLRLESIGFESFLGHPGLGSSSDLVIGPGILSVLEVSFLDVTELAALQPSTFPLVNLLFRMTALENSTLEFLKADLSDPLGNAFSASLQAAEIYAVPLPSTLLLLSGAVLGIGTYRRFLKLKYLKG